MWVRDRSRSLKMVPIDRSHTSYYWSVIVSIALFVTVFEALDAKEYCDLEIYVRGLSKWYHSIDHVRVLFAFHSK